MIGSAPRRVGRQRRPVTHIQIGAGPESRRRDQRSQRDRAQNRTMNQFCLLSRPEEYVVQDWDLVHDPSGRDYWLQHFRQHMEYVLAAAEKRDGPVARGRMAKARTAFAAQVDRLARQPDCLPGGKLRVIDICRLREQALRDAKLPDPFGHVKQRENAAALEVYPSVVSRLDGMETADRWLHLVECVLAGNIFDLGSSATMNFADDGVNFLRAVDNLPERPWLVDQYDRLKAMLPIDQVAQWTKAVIFVDNAGADFILGAMPLARALALAGVKIILAANEQPSLNDITADEAVAAIESLAAQDLALADLIEAGTFEVASSGNDLPLIDLSNVSQELNEAAQAADLVVLVGMGRAVESNFDTPFTCDCLRLCMLKDQAVAARIGGKVFDVVCKFTQPAGAAAPAAAPQKAEAAESGGGA